MTNPAKTSQQVCFSVPWQNQQCFSWSHLVCHEKISSANCDHLAGSLHDDEASTSVSQSQTLTQKLRLPSFPDPLTPHKQTQKQKQLGGACEWCYIVIIV